MAKISTIIGKLIVLKPKWFWRGFAIGAVYFGYIFFWMWGAYPLNFLPAIGKPLAIILIFLPFALLTFGMAFFWGGFLWLIQKIKNNEQRYFFPFLAGGLFAITEYLRSWFFSILWLGNGSLLGAHWPLGNPAYLFNNISPIFKTLSIWGIYGLDFWIVFIAVSLFFFIKFKKKWCLIELILAIAIIPILGVIQEQKQVSDQTTPKIPIAIIQTAYTTKSSHTAEETLDHFKQELVMLKEAAKNMTNEGGIIIFAEGADFSKTLSLFLDPISVKTFFNGLSKKELLIVDSDQLTESGALKLKTVFISSQKGVIDSYDKHLLMPGTEYLPYLLKWPLFLINPALKKDLANYQEFSKGTGPNILRYQNLWIKTLICSDLLSPELSRSGNFDFILVQNGFGVFSGGRTQLSGQLLAMTKARAIENGKYLVFASNFGRSYILNPSGTVIKIADDVGYKILTGDIVPHTDKTWYNKLGDWPILILSLAFIILGFFPKFFDRSFKKNANQV